ncbi:MAG: F0F1 ATP synthase subunit alpha, partial [Nitrospirae bacterium]|nr:F0F1 ATP synthase subunit alpha [Nitrospirota bacterium]
QLAWLMGYNRGLFDDVLPGNIGQLLQWVATKLSASQLTLDSRDDQWAEAVTSWLKEGPSK